MLSLFRSYFLFLALQNLKGLHFLSKLALSGLRRFFCELGQFWTEREVENGGFNKAGLIFSILLAGLTYFIPDAKPKTPDEELLLKTCIPCYMGIYSVRAIPDLIRKLNKCR